MREIKDLEYGWIFKCSFYVNAYTIQYENGNTYVVYAHDFNDMGFFLTRLDVHLGNRKQRIKDCEDSFEKRDYKSYIADKKGNPKKKPFWYRGRVYKLKSDKKSEVD